MYTSGAIILTNDGDFIYRVTHPKHEIEKTYTVTVKGTITDEEVEKLRKGIKIEEYITKKAKVKILKIDKEKKISRLEITIHEGKNRQIRKMCEQLNLDVARLKRISVGTVKLGMLAPGKWRYLDTREVRQLYAAASEKAVNLRRK